MQEVVLQTLQPLLKTLYSTHTGSVETVYSQETTQVVSREDETGGFM